MFRPISALFRLLQFCSLSKMILYDTLWVKIVITWRWPLLAETCSYFLLLNTTTNPYYHSCVSMTDIYLTISLSTHNGEDKTQNWWWGSVFTYMQGGLNINALKNPFEIAWKFEAANSSRTLVQASWNMMAHALKPDFVLRRNGRVHLNRPGDVSSVDHWQPRCAHQR